MVTQRENNLLQFKVDAANDVLHDETVICSLCQLRNIDNVLSCNHEFCSVCLVTVAACPKCEERAA